jgi:hypothetical protein
MVRMNVALNDGLNDVVNVIDLVLVNPLALVDDGLLGRTFGVRVTSSVQRSEHGLVLIGSNVLLANLGLGVDLLVALLLRVLGVEDGLSVVLNVVNVTVNFALTLDFLNLVTLVSLVGDGSKVLVVVSRTAGVLLVEEAVRLGGSVRVVRRVSDFADLLANTSVGTVSRRGSGVGGGSGSSRGSSAGGSTSRGASGVGGGNVRRRGEVVVGVSGRRLVVVGRVVREDLLDLVHFDRRVLV